MNKKHIISLVTLVMLTGTSCWGAAGNPNDAAIGNRPIEFIMESVPLGPMSLIIQQLDPSALVELIQSLRVTPEVRQEAVEALSRHLDELVCQHNGNVQAALFDAAENNKPWAIKPLKQAGADVNAVSVMGYGMTALMAAAFYDHATVINELIESEANVDATNNMGNTALIFASLRSHAAIVNQLLRAKANVNATSIDGITALINAINTYNREIAALLISRGADISNLELYQRERLEEWGLLD